MFDTSAGSVIAPISALAFGLIGTNACPKSSLVTCCHYRRPWQTAFSSDVRTNSHDIIASADFRVLCFEGAHFGGLV